MRKDGNGKPIEGTLEIIDYVLMIGKKVQKTSGKPFKSGRKDNTVKGLVRHPTLNNLCYIFVEDDSYVECWRCCIFRNHNEQQNERIQTDMEAGLCDPYPFCH